jgi:uncharacterized protein (TIGR00725 family)
MGIPLANRTIAVIGSGTDEHDDLARPLGRLLAALGVNLLTGGGQGVMKAVSRAFTIAPRTRGICIGIIPCASAGERARPKDGYPNEFVELPIFTHLPYSGERGRDDLSRNHINVLSSAAIVALPGAAGTEAEMSLANDYGKPLTAFSRADRIGDVEAFLRRVLDHRPA